MSLKMYVLVRKDLPGAQPAVQAGHALAQYMMEYPGNIGAHIDEWCNGTLVYLAVESDSAIKEWMLILEEMGAQYSYFLEPDIGEFGELTAIAALDYPDRRLEKLFKNLSLL